MFISKKRFIELCERVDNLERTVGGLAEANRNTAYKLKVLDEIGEDAKAAAKAEKLAFEGMQNIFGYDGGMRNGK